MMKNLWRKRKMTLINDIFTFSERHLFNFLLLILRMDLFHSVREQTRRELHHFQFPIYPTRYRLSNKVEKALFLGINYRPANGPAVLLFSSQSRNKRFYSE